MAFSLRRAADPKGWRLPWWILGPIVCTLLALFFASGGVNLQRALIQWYTWGALAVPIVWLDRRLPVRRDALGLRAALHLPLSVAWTVVFLLISHAVQMILSGQPFSIGGWLTTAFVQPPWQGAIQWNIIYYWLIIGAYFAIDAHDRSRERERRATELERLLVESQLSALRSQLHPHFLFNALNTVSAEVERQPKVARRMLEHLGELLRLSLESTRPDRVSLTDELEMLDHYLAIQRTRFAGRLDIQHAIGPDTRDALVPGLLLQPLVENAIRHGIAPRVQPGRVRISAARTSEPSDVPGGERLVLTVEDDGVGLPEAWTLDQHGGIGLTNTRQRLDAQYGASHTFSVRPAASGGTTVTVALPFETAPLASEPLHGGASATARGTARGTAAEAGTAAAAAAGSRTGAVGPSPTVVSGAAPSTLAPPASVARLRSVREP